MFTKLSLKKKKKNVTNVDENKLVDQFCNLKDFTTLKILNGMALQKWRLLF